MRLAPPAAVELAEDVARQIDGHAGDGDLALADGRLEVAVTTFTPLLEAAVAQRFAMTVSTYVCGITDTGCNGIVFHSDGIGWCTDVMCAAAIRTVAGLALDFGFKQCIRETDKCRSPLLEAEPFGAIGLVEAIGFDCAGELGESL